MGPNRREPGTDLCRNLECRGAGASRDLCMVEVVDQRQCDEAATRFGESPEPICNPDSLGRFCDRIRVGMGGESACRFVEQGRSLVSFAPSGDGHEDIAGERRSSCIVEKPTTQGENRRAVGVKGPTDVDGLVFECRVCHGRDFRPIGRRSNTRLAQNSDAASCNTPRK